MKTLSKEEAKYLFENHIRTANITLNYLERMYITEYPEYDDYEERNWCVLNNGYIRNYPESSGSFYKDVDMIDDLIEILSKQEKFELYDSVKPLGSGTYAIQ